MKPWAIILISVVSFTVLSYLAGVVYFYFFLFHRMKHEILLTDVKNLSETQYKPYYEMVMKNMKEFMALPYQEVSITSEEGCRLYGKYYDKGSDKTIIFYHGYHADPYNNINTPGLWILEHGYNLLVITQRSHGKSEGKWITFGRKEHKDALAWIRFTEDTYHPKSIAVWGVSMGGGTVGLMTPDLPSSIRAVILDCAFSGSYNEILHTLKSHTHYPPYLFLALLNLLCITVGHFRLRKNDVRDALKQNHTPVFFIHGTKDRMVPYSMGMENYLANASEKEMLTTDCEHALSVYGAHDEVEERVLAFLEKHM